MWLNVKPLNVIWDRGASVLGRVEEGNLSSGPQSHLIVDMLRSRRLCHPRTKSKQKALLPQTELATRYASVKILSTVETSCKTNPQLIEVMELKGYSWPTCSKQPRLVDYCIGLHIAIINKLDRRRRRRRVLLKTRSTYRGHVFPKFPYNTPRDRWKYVSMTKPSSIRSVVSMQHRLSSYRRTHGDSNYRASIASRGKKNQC